MYCEQIRDVLAMMGYVAARRMRDGGCNALSIGTLGTLVRSTGDR